MSRILFILLMAASLVFGGEANLAWDPSPSAIVTNYMIFAHTNANARTNYSLATASMSAGTNTSCTFYDMTPGIKWWVFVAAVSSSSVISDPSNTIILEEAFPPANMRSLTVKYGNTLTGMTNYTTIWWKLAVP